MLRSVHIVRMNRKGFVPVAFLMAVLFVFAVGAGAASKPSATELAAITERGRLLAQYDAAAWHATDAVIATHPKANHSGRYIAHKTVTGWVVDFGRLNETGDKFLVAHEAVQIGSPAQFEARSFDLLREDTGWNLAAAKGIETATKDFGRTDRPYNVAVLPAAQESMYVYLYPAQVKTGVYPLYFPWQRGVHCQRPTGTDRWH
jgi:hypothetical protein